MTQNHEPTEQSSSQANPKQVDQDSPSLKAVQKKTKTKWFVWIILAFILLGGGFVFQDKIRALLGLDASKKSDGELSADKSDAQGKAQGKGRGQGGGQRGQGRRGERSTPVVAVAKIGTGQVIQGLSALGTVVASESVIVRPRVDGLLQKIHFTEGQFVRKGQLLAEIDPRAWEVALAQAQGQLLRDQAQLATARQDLARYQQLQKLDAIAKQQVDTQLGAVRQLEASIKIDQASINNAKLQLSYTKVIAPINGRVGLKQVDAGNMVRSSDTNGLVIITQTQPVFINFPISQNDLPSVLKPFRAKSEIAVIALDRDAKVELARGKLLSIDNQIDPTTGTVKLRAKFTNADDALFVNQFVNVNVVLAARENVILAPQSSLIRGAEDNYVYTLQDGNTVKKQSVKLGQTQGEMIEIKEGLKLNDVVVIDGLDALRDGAKVNLANNASPASSSSSDKADNTQSSNASEKKSSAPDVKTEKPLPIESAPTKNSSSMTPAARPDNGEQAERFKNMSEEEKQKRRDAWQNMSEEEKQARRAEREARRKNRENASGASDNTSSQAGK